MTTNEQLFRLCDCVPTAMPCQNEFIQEKLKYQLWFILQ